MTIESNFNVPFIAAMALREKQIQQNYRPIIAVHKWFARRPGTLFRGLILAEFGDRPVDEIFYQANDFPGRKVADPFMGGGTPLLEANRVGCDVLGRDINPMAAWVVREEIEHLDLEAYGQAIQQLVAALSLDIGDLYRTRCVRTGQDATVKYALWVKQGRCEACDQQFDLFRGYLLAEDVRHPKNVVVCATCGELNEVADLKEPGACNTCNAGLVLKGPVARNKCPCSHCGHINIAPFRKDGPPQHRLFALEYHLPKKDQPGRLFKKPDSDDLARVAKAKSRWAATAATFVPDDLILAGDETNRLHRWGYKHWRELFNDRQLLGLQRSAEIIAGVKNPRVRRALATNLSDLLRYQNMACRYDTMALKSLDVFSVHGFPIGFVVCESNILGIRNGGNSPVGSGGWTNITDKYTKAKRYCDDPFEVEVVDGRKRTVHVPGEWIGEARHGSRMREVVIECGSSTDPLGVPDGSLDAVLTDPPYFGMVQYGELMEFCYVWLRRLMGHDFAGMERASAHHSDELTGNDTQGRDLAHFTEGLAAVYAHAARALKSGAPLAFTYHHNKLEAYAAIGVAILDAGLTCTTAIPCPAEMGGSIHISGTGSSIVDTVFVCRTTGTTAQASLFEDATGLALIVANDIANLRSAGLKGSDGDIRCVVFGHLARMAIWNLRCAGWNKDSDTKQKLSRFMEEMDALGTLEQVRDALNAGTSRPLPSIRSNDLFFEKEVVDVVAF